MKYILIFVLFTMNPNEQPVIGHKVYESSQKCEQAKQWYTANLPYGKRSSAICVSEYELLYYTRT